MAAHTPIPLAIVGISCRFPAGANSPEEFWSMLSEGRSAWSEVPSDRFNSKAFYHPSPDVNGTTNHQGGHFLSQDISTFDAGFFGITPSEASAMDPQQRLQLETAYEALENAGVPLEQLRGSKTSVHVAIFSRDYDRMMYKDTSDIANYHMTGSGDAIASNRISYTFDLKGPSMTLDTGCSGGLVALHQGAQSLRTGEVDMAIVGGTNLILTPDAMIPMSLMHVLNPEGRCFAFDSRGSGYGRGEGVAALVIKRLDDALKAGDKIRTVIRHTGVNQDGKTSGIALPNQHAQENLVRGMYQELDVDPLDVQYIEAHGTGTIAGDVTEMKSISNVFCSGDRRQNPLYVGSVKSNIGHLESASGLAGLIKTVMILEKGYIPPNINLEKIKSGLEDQIQQIRLPRAMEPFPTNDSSSRYASVNSFGYGGTNAHVVLEALTSWQQASVCAGLCGDAASSISTTSSSDSDGEGYVNVSGELACIAITDRDRNGKSPPTDSTYERARTPQLLVLTAKSEQSLIKRSEDLANWVSGRSCKDDDLCPLAYTLSTRRSYMPWRCSVIASNFHDLESLLVEKKFQTSKSSTHIRLTCLFTGQGAQWFAMGRELISAQPKFRKSMTKSDQILQGLGASWGLVEELSLDKSESRIDDSKIAQPATTAIQIALVDLLGSLGIQPTAVLGHSSGEIAAAYAAGVLSHHAALSVSYHRGFISSLCKQKLDKKGAMLAVALGEDEACRYIAQLQTGIVSVACVNSPASTTISGDEAAIDELKAVLDDQAIFARKLKVDIAYHSHHVQKVAAQYRSSLKGLESNAPRPSVRFISSVTATEKSNDFGPSYWVQNLTSPVRFSDALAELCRIQHTESRFMSDSVSCLIEVGPHSALSGPTRQILSQPSIELSNFRYLPSLIRDHDSLHSILTLCGKLFELGYPLNLDPSTLFGNSNTHKAVVHNLPPYPWDHSTKHWHESRLSKEFRFRSNPHHDLLGVRIPSATPFEPVWRNILDLEMLPWLRDHAVDNSIIFPGSGYLCMAVEAIRQDLQTRQSMGTVRQYIIRDIVFSKALLVPEPPGKIEIQLSLKALKIGNTRDSSGWNDFRIFSLSQEGVWSENCRGSIMVEFNSAADGFESLYEESQTSINLRERIRFLKGQSLRTLSSDDFYQKLRSNGNDYGPNFALLEDLGVDNLHVLGTLQVPDIAACMPANFMQPHVIHPATLDAVFHINLPLFLEHCSSGSVMPLAIEEIIIPANLPTTATEKFQVIAELVPEGPRSARTHVIAFPMGERQDSSLPLVISSGELCSVGEVQKTDSASHGDRNITYQLEWNLDADYMTPEMYNFSDSAILARNSALTPDQKAELLDTASSLYIKLCLDHLQTQPFAVPEKHHNYLLNWMRRYIGSELCQNLIRGLSEKEITDTPSRIQKEGVEGEAVNRIGKNLIEMLAGKVDPLALLLEGGLFYRLYSDDSSIRCYSHLKQHLEHLVFKNPDMKILEIGAGTGGTTLPVLRTLTQDGRPMFGSYDFTDISPGFFDPARSLLKEWLGKVRFKTLDIEHNPDAQGFAEESYDLVIASNVLHATKSLDNTLENVRRLLKPGGRLALIELTRLRPAWSIVFGLLPGWWNGYDEGRKDSPLLSTEQWDNSLSRNGFTGVKIAAQDFERSARTMTMMISRADYRVESPKLPFVEILVEPNQGVRLDILADEFCSALEVKGFPAVIQSWKSSKTIREDKVYVILDPSNQPSLANLSSERFQEIRSLVTKAKQMFWISAAESNTVVSVPEKGLTTGFARAARSENEGLKLITFDVRTDSSLDKGTIEAASTVFSAAFGLSSAQSSMAETEYAYQDGRILIPRLIPDDRINDVIKGTNQTPKAEPTLFRQSQRSLKLHVGKPGLLDSLVFIDDYRVLERLRDDELEIEVDAFGVNFKDLFIALGQMKATTPMAGECSGIVTAVGSHCRSQFRVGDRVCAWYATPYANHARARASNASRIPNSMSFITAASMPVIFLTAYYGLVEIANLQKGQAVLIHSAAGGVGQAAIQIAQHLGAKIFATVGSVSKRQELVDKFAIPESQIFSNRSRGFKQGLLRMTGGEGVDVILNSLSGEALLDSWDCIAKFGTFVEIGKSDIYRNSQLGMKPFERNVKFASLDLVGLADHRPEIIRAVFEKVISMFEKGVLTSVQPVTTMAIADIQDAFRLIQSRKHTGKVVLTVGEETMVKALPPPNEPMHLEGIGTYVIAGGLGGLGQKIIHFLANHGAKNILVLSRRNLGQEERNDLEKKLSSSGAIVRIETCDIAQLNEVQDVAARCLRSMPPVKGVIQAAMVLQDRILEQMSYEDFGTAVQPKVSGTANLDKVFENPSLDFFIMLSSIASIAGPRSQANYAAGNAFQDELARSRTGFKAHYLSLNLGMIDESDVIASNPELRRSAIRAGCIPLQLSELFALLGYAMSSQAHQEKLSQIAIGFDRQSLLESQRSGLLEIPLFNHLVVNADKNDDTSTAQNTKAVDKAIVTAEDLGEVHNIMAAAIAKQISALLAVDLDNITLDSPMESLGLDSLIAIELKAWITRTLQAAMQTSEILDTPNIRSLATTVAKRSTLVSTNQKQATSDGDPVNAATNDKTMATKNRVSQSTGLPLPPLADLKSTLEFYLYTISPFCSKEEYQRTSDAVQEFLKPGGLGLQLQSRLEARVSDNQIDNWLFDLYNQHVYLKQRAPIVPCGNFFGCHAATQIQHSQAERAAVISKAAFEFKQSLEKGEISPDFLNEQQLCMNTLQWLFHSIREPHKGVDQMRKFPSNDYLIAMRHGHFFKVALKRAERNISLPSLRATFQAILDRRLEDASPITALTADERDSWTEIRPRVTAISEGNRELVEMIEASAFIVCLDDGSPSTPTDRSNHFLWGDVRNRWNDKPLQFAVCENGVSAYVCEHALVDGTTLRKLSNPVRQAIEQYEPNAELERSPQADVVAPLEEYTFTSNADIDNQISRVERRFHASICKTEYVHSSCTSFGASFLKLHNCAAKSGYQLVIQLASLLYFGYNPPSWETITMRTFDKGRVDIIQTVLPEVAEFCSAVRSSSSSSSPFPSTTTTSPNSNPTLRALFHKAAKAHTNAVTRISRGRGFAHHLYALQEVRNNNKDENEPTPALFADPTYNKTRPGKIMTDCVDWEGAISEGGYAMPDPEHVWVHYQVEEEKCRFAVKAPVGRAGEFVGMLEVAAGLVRGVLVEGGGRGSE